MSDDDSESVSREASPCSESPRPVSVGSESPNENICTITNQVDASTTTTNNITNNSISDTNNSNIAILNKNLHVVGGAQGCSKAVSCLIL